MHKNLLSLVMTAACVLAFALSASAQGTPTGSGAVKFANPVNLNTATVEQLASLPGVGDRTAQLIVEYRQKNGPFKKAEDLMNVRGIGEKSFLKLKPLVTVTSKAEQPAAPSSL